ncbi:MAG: hypothetical protein AAF998_29580, partial [Bacteroidota bacterium]
MDSFYDRLRILRDFLADPQEDAYLFVCFSYVGLWREVIRLLRDELEVAGVNLTWVALDAKSDLPALAQLEKAAEKKSGAMVITGLAPRNPGDQMEMLTSLNFGREALYEIGGGKLFFVSDEAMRLVRRWAVDLFSQRARTTVYFPEQPETAEPDLARRGIPDQLSLDFPERVTFAESDKGTQLRIKILQRQWQEGEAGGVPRGRLYRDIGLPLAEAYLETGRFDPAENLLLKLEGYFDGTGQQKERARVLKNLGRLSERKGKLERAMDYYERFRKTALQLLEQSPRWEYAQGELGVAHLRIGGVQQSQGKMARAKENYEKGRSIFRELITWNPKSERAKEQLAISYSRLGDINQAQGQLDAALKYYEQYRGLTKELAESNPQSEPLKNSLAISYSRLGDINQAQ